MGTTSVSPGPATRCSPATVKCASPTAIANRSSWWGCRCSVIDPPGALRQLNRTTSLAPSCAVAVTVIDSTVAGLENSRNSAVAVSVVGMVQVFSVGMGGGAVLAAIPVDCRGDGGRERRARAPERGLVLGRVKHEGLVKLVGHLDQFPQERVEQAESAHGQLGQVADADRLPDIAGQEVEELAGRDRLGSR